MKGWGLKAAAQPGNHSSLPQEEEVNELKAKQGIKGEKLYERFAAGSVEGKFLAARSEKIYSDIKTQHALRGKNQDFFLKKFAEFGEIPQTLDINTKMTSYPHTPWMLGQLICKTHSYRECSLG